VGFRVSLDQANTRRRPITPTCCAEMKAWASIRIHVSYASTFKAKDSSSWTAEWYLRLDRDLVYEQQNNYPTTPLAYPPPPTHCPYCGTKLPALRRKVVAPSPLCRTEDMSYCETCGDRLMGCKCWPVESAWEAVVKLPKRPTRAGR